jgi:hypothetical protein
MDHTPAIPTLYGVMAEFEDPTSLVEATRRTYDEGYRSFDSFSPYPIHEIFDAMHIEDRRVPLLVLAGGITGMLTGLGLQVWVSAIAYPLNIGGRPHLSWPMFIPVTFELTILFAAFAAVFGMFILNGLPQPYHPVFNVERFAAHASQDRFFLAIEAKDPKFGRDRTRQFLMSLGAREVNDVEE